MVVFCGLPGPQDKDDSARGGSGSGSWILFSHTWGMSAHAHYIHSKGCVQRDQFHKINGYCMQASIFRHNACSDTHSKETSSDTKFSFAPSDQACVTM